MHRYLRQMTAFLGDNGIAKMHRPERLEVIDPMPMTPTRKISKDELKLLKSVGQALSGQGAHQKLLECLMKAP